MKNKYYYFVAILFLAIISFLAYENAQSKKISCSPEKMSLNCEVRKYFSMSQNKLFNMIIENNGSTISFQNSCTNYYNDFAKQSDTYYDELKERNPELTLNQSEFICRDGENDILVYYKYRVGNQGAFCFDGDITNQTFKAPTGYHCEE